MKVNGMGDEIFRWYKWEYQHDTIHASAEIKVIANSKDKALSMSKYSRIYLERKGFSLLKFSKFGKLNILRSGIHFHMVTTDELFALNFYKDDEN